jgi:F0F1-type ATP synthase assembly protein I
VNVARRFLLVLTVAALAVAALQGLTGLTDLALYSAPLFLIVALLLGGRFFGEEWIEARVRATGAVRRVRQRRWGHARDRALASLLERGACQLRGPPAPVAA